jgi:hypothetical protein
VLTTLLSPPTARAALTIEEPDSDGIKDLDFSFNPNLSFLAKSASSTLRFVLKLTNRDTADPKTTFQVVTNPTLTTKTFVEFGLDDQTASKIATIGEANRTFAVKFSFAQTELLPADPASLNTRTSHTLEFGLHSTEQALDAKENKVNVALFFDGKAPTSAPSGESIRASDSVLLVTLPTEPSSDVFYLVLAYGVQQRVRDSILDGSGTQTTVAPNGNFPGRSLIVQDILNPNTYNRGTVCFEAVKKSVNASGDLTFKFSGSSSCGFKLENGETYVAALAFADKAGNLIMSSSTHTDITPRELVGVLSQEVSSCTQASTGTGISGSPGRPDRPLGNFPWLAAGWLAMLAGWVRGRAAWKG